MSTLFMTKGLPGSGKSTWARQAVAESQGLVVDVTKDALRLLPDAPKERGKKERWVIAQRDAFVRDSLAANLDVIVHDTGFNPIHEKALRAIADEFGAYFQIVDFTHVDPQVCIERDAKRDASVGPSVIMGMWQQYIYRYPSSLDTGGVKAVIVDIDGTVARMTNRRAFDWHAVGSDIPVTHVVDLVKILHSAGHEILFTSGRDESCREETSAWLEEHVGVPHMLFMRPSGDTRKDSVVKEELYEKFIKGFFDVKFVLDDRDQVVRFWREKAGIPCFQVEYGFF